MSYIGREPQIGNFQVCDAISVVNGQAAYTMQVSSVNVSPETANHMLVSLNGVLQAPTSSYTVSGSTITFASNLVTGDVINFIHILGSVLDLGVPSDATVSTAKIVDGAVTSAKLASGTGGKVLQMVHASHATAVTQTADSYATSGLTATITPASSSNKVLVLASLACRTFGDGSTSSGRTALVALFRGTTSGTNLQTQNTGVTDRTGDSSVGTQGYNNVPLNVLDSPSTASSQVYTVGISGSGACDIQAQAESNKSTITLIEIAG